MTMLGYTNTSKAVNDHCRWVTKRYIPHPQGKGTLEVNMITEGDLYRLIAHSEAGIRPVFLSFLQKFKQKSIFTTDVIDNRIFSLFLMCIIVIMNIKFYRPIKVSKDISAIL